MTPPLRRLVSVSVAVTGGLILAACGSSADASESLIESELADQIGLGELAATCEEPDSLETGDTFTCTATTEDEHTIEFLGTKTEDDINVVTTNLLTVDDVAKIRAEGARVLTAEVGDRIVADDIDCGEESVILDDAGDFECEITDATNGNTFELTISTGGLEPGGGPKQLYYAVGPQTN